MNTKHPKADFKAFTKLAKENREIDDNGYALGELSTKKPKYRHLQVRVTDKDANRFKSVIASQGLSVQSVLVESINHWMQNQQQPPISDPGTAREKHD